MSGVEIFSIREVAGAENEIEVGDRIPLVPAHTLAVGGAGTIARGVRVGLKAHHSG